jgi:hypothetical protein
MSRCDHTRPHHDASLGIPLGALGRAASVPDRAGRLGRASSPHSDRMAASAIGSHSLLDLASVVQLGSSKAASASSWKASDGTKVSYDAGTVSDYVLSCHYSPSCGPSGAPGVVTALSDSSVRLLSLTPTGMRGTASVSARLAGPVNRP